MKTLTMLLVGFGMSLAVADEAPPSDDLAACASSDGKQLERLLDKDWTVRVAKNEITLESKFEVYHIGMVNGPGAALEFSDDTPIKRLMSESKPEKYVIRLRYEQMLSKVEFERRRNLRQNAADILNHGTKTIEEYENAGKQFSAIKVPKYKSGSFYVYEELPETLYGQFYPPKSVQKVGGAKEILAIVLGRIRSAND